MQTMIIKRAFIRGTLTSLIILLLMVNNSIANQSLGIGPIRLGDSRITIQNKVQNSKQIKTDSSEQYSVYLFGKSFKILLYYGLGYADLGDDDLDQIVLKTSFNDRYRPSHSFAGPSPQSVIESVIEAYTRKYGKPSYQISPENNVYWNSELTFEISRDNKIYWNNELTLFARWKLPDKSRIDMAIKRYVFDRQKYINFQIELIDKSRLKRKKKDDDLLRRVFEEKEKKRKEKEEKKMKKAMDAI